MTADAVTATMNVDVAFITVNYNTRPLLEELVNFFRTNALPFSYSFTVVDNASGDDSIEFLNACPDVTTISNDENLGYGRAMNQGISATVSRYLCLLNTDVILNAEALTALVDHCGNRPQVAVCSPVIRYRDGRIQGFFYKFSLATLYLESCKKVWNTLFKLIIACSSEPVPVDGIAGAFIFCRRDIATNGHLFDEEFFFYYEDTELAHRLMKQGMRCEVLPRCSIVHIGGQSSSIRHIRLFYTGKYRYLKKHYGAAHAKSIFRQDVVRVSCKLLFYRCATLVSTHEKICSKLEIYEHVSQILQEIRDGNGV